MLDMIEAPIASRYRLAAGLLRGPAFDRWHSLSLTMTDISYASFRERLELEFCPPDARQARIFTFQDMAYDPTVTIAFEI